MKQYLFAFVFIALFFSMSFASKTVFAEDVPTTKCVTTATEATYAKAIAQMEKDIAPYAKDEKATAVVTEYKQYLETAWQAMQQPYCGYGAYGTASAIKSFSKSISRARTGFLEKIKNPSTAKISLMKEDATPVVVAEQVKVTTTSKIIKKVTTSTTPVIRTGLHRGMRSDSVMEMQKRLAKHFKLSEDGLATGYFGSKTQNLIIKFQLENKLIPSESCSYAGLVGPKTVSALNRL